MSGADVKPGKSEVLRRTVLWTSIVLVILIAAHALLDRHYRSMYETHLRDAIEAGSLLPPDTVAVEELAAEDNALTALRVAAAPLVERHQANPDREPSYVLLAYTPEIWKTGDFALSAEEDEMVSFGIATARESLQQLRAAENVPEFALERGWREGDDTRVNGDDLIALSLLSRYAAARAWWEGSRGNVDGACRWISSALALAARLDDEPMVISAIIRINMGQNALTILKNIMDQHALPEAWEEVLTAQVEQLRARETFARALAAEAGVNTQLAMRNIDNDQRFWVYLTRPMARRFMCGTLDGFDAIVQGIREEDTAQRLAAYENIEENMGDSHALPTLLRSVEAFENTVVRCDMLLLAMRLKGYQAENGVYPETLDGLVPDFIDAIPSDAYAAEPYAYVREGDGFMLYSAGAAWWDETAPNKDATIICRFDS